MRIALSALALCLVLSHPAILVGHSAPGTAGFNPAHPPTTIVVGPRDTLYSIAEKTRSPVQGLIEVNGLTPPYALTAGEELRLPPLKVHVAARGETLEDIAGRYAIHPRSLAVFNRLGQPWFIAEGQRIILPPLVRDRFSGLEPQDLVDLLAAELATGRPVRSASVQSVRPSPAPPPTPAPKPAPKPKPKAPTPKLVAPKAPTPKTVPPKAPTPKAPVTPPRETAALPPLRGATGLFQWPLLGSVVETFGDKAGFRRSDGIDIAGDLNAPFMAAADGVVAYVGNELPGYGWLVLVRHSGDLMTAYAYANRVRVREGDRVQRGQAIGEIGATGRASGPRLHFQVRRATRPVDPMGMLPRRG
jgi:murein DD-endopeptidase MepM/ murein hydrolase activator NlpD